MKLTFMEALGAWAKYGGPRPIRTGFGDYEYRYGGVPW